MLPALFVLNKTPKIGTERSKLQLQLSPPRNTHAKTNRRDNFLTS